MYNYKLCIVFQLLLEAKMDHLVDDALCFMRNVNRGGNLQSQNDGKDDIINTTIAEITGFVTNKPIEEVHETQTYSYPHMLCSHK